MSHRLNKEENAGGSQFWGVQTLQENKGTICTSRLIDVRVEIPLAQNDYPDKGCQPILEKKKFTEDHSQKKQETQEGTDPLHQVI